MTFCTVHKFGDSLQCEWTYECSDFELGWITFCILCTCFSPLWVSMCRIMWFQNSCTRCIFLDSLQCVFRDISWATVPVEKLHWVHLWAQATGSGIQDDNSRGENWVYTLHWEQLWRRNDRGPLSEDVGRLVQWNYVPVWRNLKSRLVEHCKYPVKEIIVFL